MGCKEFKWKARDFLSDAMVPQKSPYQDKENWIPISCQNWGGTYTETDAKGQSDDDMSLRKYWQLQGVVLGPPPFAINEVPATETGELSNVEYGLENSIGVKHSQNWENVLTLSAGFKVHAGFLDEFLGISDQFDIGYKHGWLQEHENSSSWSANLLVKMGTSMISSEDLENLDQHAWGIFSIPTMLVQDFRLYSYDYDINKPNTGRYLGQDLHSTQVLNDNKHKGSVQQIEFRLADPGGDKDEIPGLFSEVPGLPDIGMANRFPTSTDLHSWYAVHWDVDNAIWGVRYPNDKLPNYLLKYSPGSGTDTEFTLTDDNLTTSGATNSIDIKNQVSMEIGTKLLGFGADFTAGYEGSFGAKVTGTTSLKEDVKASLGMKDCSAPYCYKSVTIQPYWLDALEDTAPWIPAVYKGQRPWCLTWRVKSACTHDNHCFGDSPLPQQITGSVVGVPEQSAASSSLYKSHYHVRGGSLTWQDEEGTRKPIPMTAGQFKPFLGATVSLNGFTWSSTQAEGKWTRHGNTWAFNTSKSAERNIVKLKLDFENRTWDFDIAKTDLSSAFKASQGGAQLRLTVNDRYGFAAGINHDVHISWDQKLPKKQPNVMELTRNMGVYDSAAGTGDAFLSGTLPAPLDFFGDMTIEVNGHSRMIPLISMVYFDDAVAKGKALEYDAGDLHFAVDFGKKTWWARFKGEAFNRLHAPRAGTSRIVIRVGGEPWYKGEVPISNHTSNLKFYGTRS